MKRRDFIQKSACCMPGMVAASPLIGLDAQEGEERPKKRKYKISLEIFEAREDTWCHKKGEKFEYPQDMHRICPWLLGSLHDFIRLLQHGVTLPWKYQNTPYEKVIDPDGITTEYVRCPDPTADLVVKITRTRVA
jgi:uncharacterized repeat protein (TIGR04076 family)